MPIVTRFDNVSEVRRQANRAGAGQRLQTEQQMQLLADQNARANAQLGLQARQVAAHIQAQQQQLLMQEQAQQFNQGLAVRQDARNQIQQQLDIYNTEFDNYISGATSQRLEQQFQEQLKQQQVVNTAAKQKLELDRQNVAINQQESDNRAEQLRQQREASEAAARAKAEAREAAYRDNLSVLDTARPFLDQNTLAIQGVNAMWEKTDQFANIMQGFVSAATAGMDKALMNDGAVRRAVEVLDAQYKESYDKFQYEKAKGDVESPEARLAFYDMQRAASDKALLNTAGAKLEDIEEITGSTYISSTLAAMATANARRLFKERAYQIAASETQQSEDRPPTPREVRYVMDREGLIDYGKDGAISPKFKAAIEQEFANLKRRYNWP